MLVEPKRGKGKTPPRSSALLKAACIGDVAPAATLQVLFHHWSCLVRQVSADELLSVSLSDKPTCI